MTLLWAFLAWVIFLGIFAWLHRRMVRSGDPQRVNWIAVIGVSGLVWAVMLFYELTRA